MCSHVLQVSGSASACQPKSTSGWHPTRPDVSSTPHATLHTHTHPTTVHSPQSVRTATSCGNRLPLSSAMITSMLQRANDDSYNSTVTTIHLTFEAYAAIAQLGERQTEDLKDSPAARAEAAAARPLQRRASPRPDATPTRQTDGRAGCGGGAGCRCRVRRRQRYMQGNEGHASDNR